MSELVLITGGAGFVGSHLADELLAHGYRVRALDDLSPQVHEREARPDYLHPNVELWRGDVRDRDTLRRALQGVSAVYHLAACVGVGQSMYEVARYTEVNNLGTALLLEAVLERHRETPLRRLVVASSMSLYGEGLYQDANGATVQHATRTLEQLRVRDWEPRDERGELLQPMPTPEGKTPALASVYALSKWDQEQLCLLLGRAYNIPTCALRFFNIYGTRQALSNPYTGVLAIFGARLLNDQPPLVNEDGLQKRDFVHVSDISRACRLAMEVNADELARAGSVFNVGSGQAVSILEIADKLARATGKKLSPCVTEQYRVGDIRHCFADITLAREVIGYSPRVSMDDGMRELASWMSTQTAIDRNEEARRELAKRGLSL